MPEPVIPQSPQLRERDARLRSLQRLAGRLAHDFNNYLSPIFGYLSLIKDETPPDSQAHEYATTMEKGVRRTTQLLEAILLAARPERRFVPGTWRFDQLIQNRIDEWKSSLPPCSQISVRTTLVPCQVYADEALWREVLGQLLQNAHFALSHGGNLEVTLRGKDMSVEEAEAAGVQPVPGVELIFQDNGPGMKEETMLYAIDPFYSTRPKNIAPGLGLSVVYGVVRLHGGQVFLKNCDGGGLQVALWVPCVATSQSLGNSSTGLNPLTNPTAKILLVEPDAIAMETATAALQKAKYFIQPALDAAGALALFEKKPKNYALVILNAHLPMPGTLDLAHRLRACLPAVPLLLLSGDAQASRMITQNGLASPFSLLNRPFKPEAILDKAKEMIPASGLESTA